MQPITLSKSLATSSSGFLGIFSTAAPTQYTSGATATVSTSSGSVGSALDTGRRVVMWTSSAAGDTMLAILTGLSSGGDVMQEAIIGSTAAGTIHTTVQDFYQITGVSFSSQPNIPFHLGTSSRGGTPWITTNTWANPFDMTVQLILSATSNSAYANFECTLEDITQATIPGPVKTLSSTPATVVPWYPTPFISQIAGSTYVSTAIDAVTGANFTAPISAWRVSMSSSGTGAAVLGVTVLQSG